MTGDSWLSKSLALLCAVLGVGSALIAGFFIGDPQVRCGLNPLIITFYVAVAGACFAVLAGLVGPHLTGHQRKNASLAVLVCSVAVLAWLWWLGPNCDLSIR